MKIRMFVFNTCKHDARVLKEAKTLAEAGYDVTITAVLDQESEPLETKEGFRIIRVNKLPFEIYLAKDKRDPALKNSSAADKHSRPGRLSFRQLIRRIYFLLKNTRGPVRKLLITIHRPLCLLKYYSHCWNLVRKEPAEVYHCHDLNTLLLGYLAKKRYGGKLVYDAHELTTELAYIARYERLVWKWLEKFLIKRADTIIATGKNRGEYLSKRYKISPPEIILNCPPTCHESNPGVSLRSKVGLMNNSQPIILYTGGYITGRGLRNLVQAAAYLKNGVVVFMGWGNLERDLREMVHEKGLETKILFTEPVPPDKLVAYVATATLGVVIYQNTSLNNYFATPNKLYEYIHAGLPVVGSHFPSLKKIIEGYGFGSTFDPEQPKSIASAIDFVLGDEKRYAIMRKNAMKAAKVFNWETESGKLLGIYRKLSRRSDDRTA